MFNDSRLTESVGPECSMLNCSEMKYRSIYDLNLGLSIFILLSFHLAKRTSPSYPSPSRGTIIYSIFPNNCMGQLVLVNEQSMRLWESKPDCSFFLRNFFDNYSGFHCTSSVPGMYFVRKISKRLRNFSNKVRVRYEQVPFNERRNFEAATKKIRIKSMSISGKIDSHSLVLTYLL